MPIKICAIKFWAEFSLESGFIKCLLDQAFGSFVTVQREQEADLVVGSIFQPKVVAAIPEKTITFIWENLRPNFGLYHYSISSDFDSYGGRNFRVPFWYGQIQWPGYIPDQSIPGWRNHGFEQPVDIDSLLQPRAPRAARDKDLFCCFVANHPELHRMMCVERLSKIGRVDVFGNVAGRPLRGSKYDILSRYRFNVCFENSTFPGYYTEKIIHAWAGGCVPLYYSDSWYGQDFNPKAMINRIHFKTLDDFVERVAEVHRSPSDLEEIFTQPLLTTRPSLDGAIEFLRRSYDEIRAGR